MLHYLSAVVMQGKGGINVGESHMLTYQQLRVCKSQHKRPACSPIHSAALRAEGCPIQGWQPGTSSCNNTWTTLLSVGVGGNGGNAGSVDQQSSTTQTGNGNPGKRVRVHLLPALLLD